MKKITRLLALWLCLLMLTGTAGAEKLTDEQLASYYQNSVMVGDSIPRMLRNYIAVLQEKDPEYLADLRFFTQYSYKLRSAARETIDPEEVNLLYKGEDYTLCQLMEALQPEKLFILAGLNDKIGEKINAGMEYVEQIMALMKQYAPDTEVHFISLLPVTYRVEEERPNLQQKWDAYNAALEKKCGEVGAIYVEVAGPLKNEDGQLRFALSHDGLYHLNDDGNAILLRTLLDFAQTRYEAGLWTPDDQ